VLVVVGVLVAQTGVTVWREVAVVVPWLGEFLMLPIYQLL
jgi:hypothetical protein